MNLAQVLDTATRARVPVLLWGAPGIGKSAAIRHWASSRNLPCWTVIASLREPADFGGLPVVGQSGVVHSDGRQLPSVTFAPPRFAVEAHERGGVIFLDELTTAPPAVQAALLRAVLDLAFGDLDLDPARVTIVAAANPPAQSAGGWDLAPPLANRFLHKTLEVSVADWVDAYPTYWGTPPTLTFASSGVSEPAWMHQRTLVAAFIRSRPGLLLSVPKAASLQGKAWPSPRSWDFVARVIASSALSGVSVVDVSDLIAGLVGDGPAAEFLTWVKSFDLPNPEALLADPRTYSHHTRNDVTYAILSSVTHAVLARPTKDRWNAGWRILARAAELGAPDVAAPAARLLIKNRTDALPVPLGTLATFLPLLTEAGLVQSGRIGA